MQDIEEKNALLATWSEYLYEATYPACYLLAYLLSDCMLILRTTLCFRKKKKKFYSKSTNCVY